MKVSSITNGSLESRLTPGHDAEPFMQVAQRVATSIMKTLDHMGTSIALGESGNLEAADAYRRKNSGQ